LKHISSRLIAIGSYLPEKVLTNHDLQQTLDTTDEWIQTRTGISKRHIARDDELTSDLAYAASVRALASAGLEPEAVDGIILATATPDHTFPATSARLQEKLGCKGLAFDVGAVCSGFLFALVTADTYIKSGLLKRVLVVGAETMSRIVDWTDRSTAILFGDGAGAIVLEAGTDDPTQGASGVISSLLKTDGRGYDSLRTSEGASCGDQVGKILMRGRDVFKNAVTRLEEITRELLNSTGIKPDSIDWVIPHQANVRIIRAVGEKLGLDESKTILTVSDHANTSSASIPLALDWGVKAGKIQKGDLLLMNAFAAGFSWGAVLLRF
jgi:3-oxoacyl-[acyl-carrier-protein] synthase-3